MLPERLELMSEGRRVTYMLRRDAGTDSAPVYEIGASGATAHPTGSVWVRFTEGTDAAERADDIERAGYRIERIPGYAANAAFVRAETIASALARLDALRAIPGVEVVEPEMHVKRAFRG